MSGLDNQKKAWVESQQSGLTDRNKATLAAAVLAVGLSTSVQASDLLDNVLKQCDGIDRQWVIHKDKRNWVIDWFAEKQCKTKVEIAQKDASIAQKDASIAQIRSSIAQKDANIKKLDEDYSKMVQILVMLEPEEARKAINAEIKRLETQLKTEKNDTTKKSILYKLDSLKARLKELDKKVA
jgi:hypothetical protein